MTQRRQFTLWSSAMRARTQALSMALLVTACSASTVTHQPASVAAGVAPGLVATQRNLGWPDIALVTAQITDAADARIAVTTSNEHNAGVWLAANVAAMVQQQPLLDFRLQANANAEFDSVAASGALTIGFLASMKRATFDADAAILGVIFPDGTIGPSDDIVTAFASALAAGKLRIGYPQSTPAKTLATLAALAKAHPNQPNLIAIADVYDGYRLLTTTALPMPAPVAEAALALDASTIAALHTDFHVWRQRALAVWPSVIEVMAAGRLPTELLHSAAHTQNLLRQAMQLAQLAQPAAAQLRMMQVVWHAQTVAASYLVLQHMRRGDVAAATEVLRQQRRTATDSVAVIGELAAHASSAPTLATAVAGQAALALAITAWNAQTEAIARTDAAQRTLLNLNSGPRPASPGSPNFDDAVIAAVLPALRAELRASALAEHARTAWPMQPPVQPLAQPSVQPNARPAATSPALQRWARGFAATAAATRRELAPSRLLAIAAEPSVLVTDVMQRLDAAPAFAALRDHNPMFEFTASQLASTTSATLYALLALDVHWANDGTVASVDHNDSLDIVVQHAQLLARRNLATTLRRTGTIFTPCKLAYARAIGLQQEGSTASRVAALETFWQTSACAQTASLLGQPQSAAALPVKK